MTKHILENANGVKSYVQFEDGVAHHIQEEDITPVIELNSYLRNNRNDARNRNFHHVGRVPMSVHHEWFKEWRSTGRDKDITFNTFVMLKLKNRDYSKFRSE